MPAGTIDSSSGSASVTPVPRRNVRRERCFFVMNVTARVPPSYRFIWNGTLLHDADDERREPVVVAGRVANDGAHGRHVEVLDPPAQRVG